MQLLHISDIHFRTPDCRTPDMDPERPYRTLLMRDARDRVRTLGSVDAILVGGDIAFKGHREEYEAAYAWLMELAQATGCPPERIFVVPGNHDVDRNVITSTPAVRNAQKAIFLAQPEKRERELRTQFTDTQTSSSLLAPLAAYNDFAKLFNCQVYSPDRLFWKQDMDLNGGVVLRLYGLTSTLLSGMDGENDKRGELYLSPLQVLHPLEDIINLVMIHHPPDWLMDEQDVNDMVNNRAAIHLFGHKHLQRVVKDDGYMRFSAGAVNPDRQEQGWEPGYNLISLQVVGSGRERALEIEAHLMVLQSNPERFNPRRTRGGEEVFRHRISIPGYVSEIAATTPRPAVAVEVPTATVSAARDDVEASMSEEHTRNLIFRFWKLTGSQRREIALGLGLIEEKDLAIPEPERYGRALLVARERGLLDLLTNEIVKRETK
ncbi:MAG: hypothetical protein CVU33_04420 [Betaproteobacteria bacterium HGW-Betaproteobacteria-6]|nr:MAG: hypothetical protein CVU33_04420 [Betaproteobacteria bacterium HGW-Betaproteobacteria-6]